MYGWWEDSDNADDIEIDILKSHKDFHLTAFYFEENLDIEYVIFKMEFEEDVTDFNPILYRIVLSDMTQITSLIPGEYWVNGNYISGIIYPNYKYDSESQNQVRDLFLNKYFKEYGMVLVACNNKHLIETEKLKDIRCIMNNRERTEGAEYQYFIGVADLDSLYYSDIGKFLTDRTLFDTTIASIVNSKAQIESVGFEHNNYGISFSHNIPTKIYQEYPVLVLKQDDDKIDINFCDISSYNQTYKYDYENYFEKYLNTEVNLEIHAYKFPQEILNYIWNK